MGSELCTCADNNAEVVLEKGSAERPQPLTLEELVRNARRFHGRAADASPMMSMVI